MFVCTVALSGQSTNNRPLTSGSSVHCEQNSLLELVQLKDSRENLQSLSKDARQQQCSDVQSERLKRRKHPKVSEQMRMKWSTKGGVV